jgi:hypothetical protein
VKEPSYNEIKRLKDLCMKGRRGDYISRDDQRFLENIYFGEYKQWWEANEREIKREIWDATKPFGSDMGWR